MSSSVIFQLSYEIIPVFLFVYVAEHSYECLLLDVEKL